jgi:transcriptional regulator with XRE-family HTH domain
MTGTPGQSAPKPDARSAPQRAGLLTKAMLSIRRVAAASVTPTRRHAEIARRVRAARAYSGLSVNDLADAVGLGVQTIKRIESGKRTARPFEIWAIAEACKLPREFFDLDFRELSLAASAQSEMLARIDCRLDKLERALGWRG